MEFIVNQDQCIKIWESIFSDGIGMLLTDLANIGKTVIPQNHVIGTFNPKRHIIIPIDHFDPKDSQLLNLNFDDGFVKTRAAPALNITKVQDIFITYPGHSEILEISIDRSYTYWSVQKELATNEGFETYDDFFNHYMALMEDGKHSFTGKIIHWTDKTKY